MTVIAREDRADAAFLRLPRSGNHHDLWMLPRAAYDLVGVIVDAGILQVLEQGRGNRARRSCRLTGQL